MGEIARNRGLNTFLRNKEEQRQKYEIKRVLIMKKAVWLMCPVGLDVFQ